MTLTLKEQRPGRARARRWEVVRVLSEIGELSTTSHRAPYAGASHASGPAASRSGLERLMQALESLGPGFVAFGRYLATRSDLLSHEIRTPLRGLRELGRALSASQVRERIEREIGRAGLASFSAVGLEPVRCSWLYQDHRAQLDEDQPVVVRLYLRAADEQVARELELLRLLAEPLESLISRQQLEEAVDDFGRSMLRAIDCGGAREGSSPRRHGPPGVAAPRLVHRVSSARLLTYEDLGGWTLDQLLREMRLEGSEESSAAGLAVSLSRAWLRVALFESRLPDDLDASAVLVLRDRRVAFAPGSRASVSRPSQLRFLAHLQAVVSEDADGACSALLGSLEGGPGNQAEFLRRELRQLVPIRDGGSGPREDVAGVIGLHWRIASRQGYRLTREHLALARGLTQLADAVRELSPERDVLKETLDGLRLEAEIDDVMRLVDPERLRTEIGAAMKTMVSLPQQIEQALTQLSEGPMSIAVQSDQTKGPSRFGSAGLVASMLGLLATALLGQRFAGLEGGGAWLERAASVGFVLFGAFALRSVRR